MLTLAPETTAQPRRPRAPEATAVLQSLTLQVEDLAVGWVVKARVHGKVSKTAPRGAVVCFQFYDVHGDPLDAPHSGFTYSTHLERRFHYVPVGDSSIAAVTLRPLLPPPQAVRLELHLQRWSGMEQAPITGELTAEPYDYTLPDLPRLEATDAEGAERVAWHWLTARKTERQYLLEIQALAWRIGAPALLREACYLLEQAPEVRGYMRQQSRYALAALDEMSDWLPLAPNAQCGRHAGLAHVVAHLAPQASPNGRLYDPIALAAAQYEQGFKPLVIVPTEYTQQASPDGPYTHRVQDGVEVIELDSLTPAAHARVKRTDLLRFDTLLSSHWISRRRVGLIHAHIGRSGYDLALRALALGAQYRLPIVMQWQEPASPCPVTDASAPPPDSEWWRQAYTQQLRCAARADAVIVTDAWQAALLLQAGIHRDRIFLVPPWSAPAGSTAPARPADSRRWIALLDVSDLSSERISALGDSLPAAIDLPGFGLQVIGPNAAVAQLEAALMNAGMQAHLATADARGGAGLGDTTPDLVIRMVPGRHAGRPDWLSDLDTLRRQGTLVLAERTPQSDCLLQHGQCGLTFDLREAGSLARALAEMAPDAETATRLRQRTAESMVSNEMAQLIVESAYRYALCAP
ncbi:glycosyltransferase [Bordetella genomosp. 2]|uniref:Glycosyltransferase subfamily 4-like N-terminal domain-containing protein n=1 Tax=Bordetella genomosp. 2 TaxID=1983456 RepID=A0A261VQE4_9BORD|nr:glycosyltransferase [Bordetella genomosp. 2]OZI75702.1 hypothetical protein CAL24_10765 [Bordetella genomosp. 2]